MTQAKKDLLRDALISTINSFSPEYIEQAEDADYSISQLLDSIEEFETECEEGLDSQEDKYRLPFDPTTRELLSRLQTRDDF